MSSGDLNYGIMLIIKESYWMSQDNLMEFKFLLFASENISLSLTSVDSADSQFDVCLSHWISRPWWWTQSWWGQNLSSLSSWLSESELSLTCSASLSAEADPVLLSGKPYCKWDLTYAEPERAAGQIWVSPNYSCSFYPANMHRCTDSQSSGREIDFQRHHQSLPGLTQELVWPRSEGKTTFPSYFSLSSA